MRCTHHGVTVAIGAILIFLSIGSLYSEGNIGSYVVSYMRIHRDLLNIDNGHQIWFLSASFGVVGPFMILGGYVMEKCGPVSSVLLGGAVMTAGMFLCSWAIQLSSLFAMVLLCAVCTGVGVGIIYIAPLKVLMTWMPRRMGLASGILVCTMTLGGGIHTALQGQLINPQQEEMVGFVNGRLQCSGFAKPEDFHKCCKDATGGGQCELYFIQDSVLTKVPEFFWKIGLVHVCLLLIGALLIRYPREGEVPGDEDQDDEQRATAVQDLDASEPVTTKVEEKVEATWQEMIRTRAYWYLFATLFFSGHIVTFITASCKHLGTDLFEITDDVFLTFLLTATMMLNGVGRLTLGALGDYLGYQRTLLIICVILTGFIGSLALGGLARGAAWEKPMCIVWLCVISFSMGGIFSNVPALSAQYFGMKHFGKNYGFIWCAVSISALISGISSSVLYDIIGSVGFVIFTACLGACCSIAVLQLPPIHEFQEEFLRHKAETAPLVQDGNPQC